MLCHCLQLLFVAALETGLGTLLANVTKSVGAAVNAQHSAAKAVTAHTDLLKKAMDVCCLL